MGSENFFKYPRTRHIFTAGNGLVSRDDLIMTPKEADLFLHAEKRVFIEEKVDGANLGFSINSNNEIIVQNRAHYVNSKTHRQFNVLDTWIEKHASCLFKCLRVNQDILFGEWLYAKHSIHYTTLPDYFLAFDIYDKLDKRFLSFQERNDKLRDTEIASVRVISERMNLNKEELMGFLESRSEYYNGLVEGIVVRIDEGLEQSQMEHVFSTRGKIVQADFIQQIEEQWTKQKLVKNVLLNY